MLQELRWQLSWRSLGMFPDGWTELSTYGEVSDLNRASVAARFATLI